MLGDLQEKQRGLDQDTVRISELKLEAERSEREAGELAEKLRLSERAERKSVKKKLTDELLQARAQVQAVIEGLEGERAMIKAKETKQQQGGNPGRSRGPIGPARDAAAYGPPQGGGSGRD